ncbi:hypothetical protein LTR93_011954 [Exophiala xenobiotica]|nr:hypothetical protein LTR93_011954 [Exophiala xenobiotica]
MAPIRVALIGLSSSASSWAVGAHLPYLLSTRGRERFIIVALCNSSVDAAQRAIEKYGLAGNIKAYGDPEEVAADPNVDLVVCCTRVDLHYNNILPSVKAGKTAYVEWPLAHDVHSARELTSIARQSGSRTVVGNQGRLAPVVLKLREMLRQGRIGKVLSSEVRAAGGSFEGDVVPAPYKYLTQRAFGGNVVTISFSHLWDIFQFVLGEVTELHPRLQIQYPTIRVLDQTTMTVTETVESDVPDLIIITATMPSSETVIADATLLFRFCRGQPFPGETALTWIINGEKGKIRLVSPTSFALHATAYRSPVTLEVHDSTSDRVELVDWAWSNWQEELPVIARNVGAVYEAIADQEESSIQSFESATSRLEQVHGMLATIRQPQKEVDAAHC